MIVKALIETNWVPENGIRLNHVYPQPGLEAAVPFGSAWASVAPGEATIKHAHRVAESFYIIRGKGTMSVGEETRDVAYGDVVFIPANQPHTIANPAGNAEELAFVTVWWESNERIIRHLNTYLEMPAEPNETEPSKG